MAYYTKIANEILHKMVNETKLVCQSLTNKRQALITEIHIYVHQHNIQYGQIFLN
jgi:hypothetical protein